MLYRPKSDHATMVEEYVREFSKRHITNRLNLVSLDTRDGASTASLYDVMQYPAILALTDDGQLLKGWQGGSLPLMNELAYYVQE